MAAIPARIETGFLGKLVEGSPAEWAGFLGSLVFLAGLIWMVVRVTAHVRGDDDPAEVDQLMLTQMSELRREGGLTESEYRSIKGEIIDRLETLENQEVEEGQPDASDQAEIDRHSEEE